MDPKEILSSVHIEECMNFEDVADAVVSYCGVLSFSLVNCTNDCILQRSRIPEMCRSKSMKLLVIDRYIVSLLLPSTFY